MTTPSTGSISFTQIVNEFGSLKTNSNQTGTDLGAYRVKETVGEMDNLPLDEGIPQDNNQISFQDFRGKRLNVIVHYDGTQERPDTARSKYDGDTSVTVIGGGRSRPANSSGTDVTIHVSGTVHGSESHSNLDCSLKTGDNWNSGTILNINVGGEGKIFGAGGDGGKGGRSENEEGDGLDGEDGSSALGVAYNITELRVQSGGIISAGGGGGGGGGGARGEGGESDERVGGAGGGGGVGIPHGIGGLGGTTPADALFEAEAYGNVEYQPENGGNGSETDGGNGGHGGANNEQDDDDFSNNQKSSAQSGGGGGGGAPTSEETGEGGGDYTSYGPGSGRTAAQDGSTSKGGDGGQADAEGGEQIEGSGGEGGENGFAIITKSGVVISDTVGNSRIKGATLPNTNFT